MSAATKLSIFSYIEMFLHHDLYHTELTLDNFLDLLKEY